MLWSKECDAIEYLLLQVDDSVEAEPRRIASQGTL